MVTATGEGGVWVWATYTYNETFPGLQRQWVAYSPVGPLGAARPTSCASSIPRSSRRVRAGRCARASPCSGAPTTASCFFNASLGGLANAFLNWKDGQWRVVSGGGVPRFGRASMALDFRTHSITRDGQILSYEDTNINGAEINLGTREGLDPFLNNNVPLGANEATSGLFITRNSYTSTGWAMVRANFRFENNPINYVGLFRGAGRVDEMLVSTSETVPELPGTFTVDADFGIAGDGTAFYSLTSGSARVFYRHDFGGRKKLVAVGDAMLGSKVRSVPRGPRRTLRASGSTKTARRWSAVALEDNSQHYPVLRAGRQDDFAASDLADRHPVAASGAGSAAVRQPYNNKGNGVHLWQGDAVNAGLRARAPTVRPDDPGDRERNRQQAGRHHTDAARRFVKALIVARMNPEPYVLFGAGDEIPVELPVNAFTFDRRRADRTAARAGRRQLGQHRRVFRRATCG